MSTTITGVHFVFRPDALPMERSKAMTEVALLHPHDHRVQITGIEYSDGKIDELEADRVMPIETFAVSLRYDAVFGEWQATLSREHGSAAGSFQSQGHAIAQLLNDMLIVGGGDWIAVNRTTGEIA